jgi:hypothetical protein
MLIVGDPSSELQQYLHRAGQPRVGTSIRWKGVFMIFIFPSSENKLRIMANCRQKPAFRPGISANPALMRSKQSRREREKLEKATSMEALLIRTISDGRQNES